MAKILVVDDSAFERKAILGILEKAGHKDIIEAEDAEQGLEVFKLEKPDLVLLDVRLPGMDGVQCLGEIKKANPDAKVIMVTIVTRQETIDEAMKNGAAGYITKPITKEKLVPKVKEVLGGA